MRSRLLIPAAIIAAIAYLKGRVDAQIEAEAAAAGAPLPPAPEPTHESISRAEAEAADAWELGFASAEAEVAATVAPPPPVRAAAPEVPPVPDFAPAPAPEPDEPPVSEWPPPAWWQEAAPEPMPAPEAVAVPAPRPVVVVEDPDPAVLAEWHGAPAGPATPVLERGRFAVGGWAAQAGHMALCGVSFRSRCDEVPPVSRVRLIPDASRNAAPGGLVVLGDAGFAPDEEGFTVLLAAAGAGEFAVSGRYELLA